MLENRADENQNQSRLSSLAPEVIRRARSDGDVPWLPLNSLAEARERIRSPTGMFVTPGSLESESASVDSITGSTTPDEIVDLTIDSNTEDHQSSQPGPSSPPRTLKRRSGSPAESELSESRKRQRM